MCNTFKCNDTDKTRTCGTCGKTKDVSEFYRDGTDSNGDVRYRRDCKECYRNSREACKIKKRKSSRTNRKGFNVKIVK